MNLLVLEASGDPRTLHRRARAALEQECRDLTILFVEREDGSSANARVLSSLQSLASCQDNIPTLDTLKLREDDGLGSLLRLLRKRYKKASTFTFCFADEEIENPHALRRMIAALEGDIVYASCGWSARDGSALRVGTIEDGALPTFRADRIDGLPVASLDELDACEDASRRRELCNGLRRDDEATFVAEILVERDVAAVAVENASAGHAVSATQVAARTHTAPSEPTATDTATPEVESTATPADELDDEPLLAHALNDSVPPVKPRAAAKKTKAPRSAASAYSGEIDEDVSALLQELAPSDASSSEDGDLDANVEFAPGLSMDVETQFASETLDENAKALLEELAAEGRLDFEELEESLSATDLPSILFVSKLEGVPDDFRARLRKHYVDGGGDPAAFDGTKNKSLSLEDADSDSLDDDTRAILEAALEGPPDLSWQDEDVDESGEESSAPEADEDENGENADDLDGAFGGDKEPSEEALEAALASLKNLEQRLDAPDAAAEEDSKPSALDGWFEDFEQEEAGQSQPESEAATDEDKPSALDGWFEDFEQEEAAKGGSAPKPKASKPKKEPLIDPTLEPEDTGGQSAWQQPEGVQGELALRARGIASEIAESLVALQQPSGEFPEPERYAKECAIALWSALDRQLYGEAIERAVDACRRRAEANALGSVDDGQAAIRAYALSAVGLADDSRTFLDESLCIDTLVESVIRARRGQIFDVKRTNLVARALDEHGILFDRWAPEDPDASTLGVREQAFATLVAGELVLRNSEHQPLVKFARRISDRLLAISRTGTTDSMFLAAATYRTADRRGDVELMESVLERLDSSSLGGDANSNGENFSEGLAFLGLHLALDLAQQPAEA